jgi:hypothetical protein
MNLLIGSALTASIAASGLAAQTPGGGSGTTAPPAKAMTVTGCVERADQLASPGAQTTTVDSQHFVLIRAQEGSGSTAAAATPRATAGSVGPMYRLVVDAKKLNPHVGHKVEVTGTLASAANPEARSTEPSASTAPMLTVQSVKMLSETCAR